jgi:hypothetical protein
MENTTSVSLTPDRGHVDAHDEVSVFGLHVNDAGEYHLHLMGSAPLAATLIDEDGVTVSTMEDGDGANPLELDVTLSPGAYTLHVRAAEKGEAARVQVAVSPQR